MRFHEFNIKEGQGGIDYENKVVKSMLQADVPGLDVGEATVGFGSHGAGDIEATWQGAPFIVEVKMSIADQMGSGILTYDRASGEIKPSQKMLSASEPDDLSVILDAANTVTAALDNYLDALANIEPKQAHAAQARKGTSFVATKDALEHLKQQGLMKPINKYVDIPSSFIAKKYNSKGTNYIQIGGKGLYYLGSNPLKLPIPEFTGDARIEIRFKQAGDSSGSVTKSFNKALGNQAEPMEARRVDLMAAGRFRGDIAPSPYTLDDPASVRALLGV